MSTCRTSALPVVAMLATLLVGGAAQAACDETNWKDCAGKPWMTGKPDTPIGEAWWPNKQWGANDQAGSTNWFTKPEVVRRGLAEGSEGKVYALGHPYTADMPLFGARKFVLRIPGSPTDGPFGANKLVYNDEFLATEIGRVGTQFDGLGHIGIQMGKDGDKNEMRYYNGVTGQELGDAYGLKKLGIENCKPFFTRGHLFDIEAVKGAPMDAGQEITVADLRSDLQKQNMQEADVKEGDAAFFNTGWGKLWMKNNDKFNSGEPGIGMEVAKWCIDKGVCLTGA